MSNIVLITGASSGIGKSAALELYKKGYIVYATARRTERMKDLAESGIKILSMDVTSEISVKSALETIVAEHGKIDVLINNAGYGLFGTVEEIPAEDAKKQFDVNFFGLSQVTSLVIPIMRKNGSGKIINISSIGGKIYTPFGAFYHATKHAVEGFSDCLRIELKPFNIKVVIIEPGIIRSEFQDVATQTLMNYSGKGAYSDAVISYTGYMNKVYSEKFSSKPSVIGKLIAKAVVKKNPKTRYTAGKMSHLSLISRKILSDRLFDWSLMKQVKLLNKFL